MEQKSQAPNMPNLLSISGTFISSNAIACPVVSHSLTVGSENFVLTDDASEFILTMTEESNAIEKLNEYTIKAIADGGATASVSGNMKIETKCLAKAVERFEKSFTFDLPASGI
jgi:uncharacterized protein YoaH (UPF0181 family)